MKCRSAAALRIWAGSASVGDRALYHVGAMAGLKPVGREAQRLAAAGLVFLYQRRHEDGRFGYYAQRISGAAGERLRPRSWEEW